MRCLRATWGKRLIVALLALSLVPLVVVPVKRAAQGTSAEVYADWLRGQLGDAADAVFEEALALTQAQHPRSFDAFLKAFLDAYERLSPTKPLVYAAAGLSGDALALYLRGRFQRLGGDLLAMRVVLQAAAVTSGKLPGRVLGLTAGPAPSKLASWVQQVEVPAGRTFVVMPLRLLSAAFPLGP